MEQTKGEVKIQKAGGSRIKKGGSMPWIVLGVAAAVLVGVYGGLCAVATYGGSLWRGTQILGQDVGGMTPEEAVAAVEASLEGREIGLYLYDSTLAAPPERSETPDASISLEDLGAEIDVPGLVELAEQQNQNGSILTSGWRYLTNQGSTSYGLGNHLQVDAAKTAAAAESAASALSWDAQDTTYTLTDDTIEVKMAQDGRSVRAGEIQQALTRGDWDLNMGLDVGYSTTSGQNQTAQQIHDQVSGEMKNARYDIETSSIVPEQTGADFDIPAAQKVLDAAAPGETVRIKAEIQFPAITAEELKAVLFRDVLGECTTIAGGTGGRQTNIRLSSNGINNYVMNTGDIFSYNDVLGQRTAAKGYQLASAYIQGETVDTIGGGICQTSSTLYLACLRANLEITERYAHRYTPSYIDWGMDATVSWGGPNYRFTNNTDYPIKIVTSYQNGKLTVKILGTNVDGSYVKMTNKVMSTTPFETVYEDDETLPAGTQQVKTTPYTGHTVRSFRNVYSANGELLSSELEAVSNYKSRNKVILRGPAPAAAPEEIPAETPPATTPPADTAAPPANPSEPSAPVVPEPPADVPANNPADIPAEPPVVILPIQPEEP
ncbi:MAG: hydrolase [Oscillibacter sp.]|nr:hydrolase [Oscillibacter sp.]